GVDVRIITPYVPDKWYVHMVTRSHYKQLLEAGVRIFEYTPGFIHAKMFVSDDTTAVVGTPTSISAAFTCTSSAGSPFICRRWWHRSRTTSCAPRISARRSPWRRFMRSRRLCAFCAPSCAPSPPSCSRLSLHPLRVDGLREILAFGPRAGACGKFFSLKLRPISRLFDCYQTKFLSHYKTSHNYCMTNRD